MARKQELRRKDVEKRRARRESASRGDGGFWNAGVQARLQHKHFPSRRRGGVGDASLPRAVVPGLYPARCFVAASVVFDGVRVWPNPEGFTRPTAKVKEVIDDPTCTIARHGDASGLCYKACCADLLGRLGWRKLGLALTRWAHRPSGPRLL